MTANVSGPTCDPVIGIGVDLADLAVVAPLAHQAFQPAHLEQGGVDRDLDVLRVDLRVGIRDHVHVGAHRDVLEVYLLGALRSRADRGCAERNWNVARPRGQGRGWRTGRSRRSDTRTRRVGQIRCLFRGLGDYTPAGHARRAAPEQRANLRILATVLSGFRDDCTGPLMSGYALSMALDRKALDLCVDELSQELSSLSRRIHAHPELCWQEHQASGWLGDCLERELGRGVERGVGGLPTAFRARVGEGSPKIAILAEYDALPEIGHACGHNLIAGKGAVGAVPGARWRRSPRRCQGSRRDHRHTRRRGRRW